MRLEVDKTLYKSSCVPMSNDTTLDQKKKEKEKKNFENTQNCSK